MHLTRLSSRQDLPLQERVAQPLRRQRLLGGGARLLLLLQHAPQPRGLLRGARAALARHDCGLAKALVSMTLGGGKAGRTMQSQGARLVAS
jgi:hypothetical protein